LNTPLHLAAKYNHPSIISYLVYMNGIDFNLKNKSSFSPVHEAAFHGSLESIKILSATPGLNINQKDAVHI